jgi:hypothetical protein
MCEPSGIVSAQQPGEPYEVIHIGDSAAAVVPLDDLRRLRAIARHAAPEAVAAAELEEAAEIRRQTDEWIAAGRPGRCRGVPQGPARRSRRVRVEWSAGAQASALRFMRDQEGMRAIADAVDALLAGPYPLGAFHAGEADREVRLTGRRGSSGCAAT